MLENDDATGLARCLLTFFADADDPACARITDAWPSEPYTITPNPPSALPVLADLPVALAGVPAAFGDLAPALQATADRLTWRQPDMKPDGVANGVPLVYSKD